MTKVKVDHKSETKPVSKSTTPAQPPRDAKLEKEYQEVVNGVADVIKAGENLLIGQYWELGVAFHKYQQFKDRTKYGAAEASKFIEDLAKAGAEVAMSTLYFARSVREHYPRLSDLQACAKRGLRVTHLKMLFPLEGDERTRLEAKMVRDDGTVISTRDLHKLVSDMRNKAAQKRIAAVTKESPPPTPAASSSKNRPKAAEGEESAWFNTEDTESQVHQEPAKAPDKGAPVPAAAKTSSTIKSFTKSPISVFCQVDKLCFKLLEKLPDAFIAVREMNQIGYDNDQAHKKAKDARKDCLAQLKNCLEVGQKLVDEIKAASSDE